MHQGTGALICSPGDVTLPVQLFGQHVNQLQAQRFRRSWGVIRWQTDAVITDINLEYPVMAGGGYLHFSSPGMPEYV